MTVKSLHPHILIALTTSALFSNTTACSTSQAKTQIVEEAPRVSVSSVEVVERTIPRTTTLTGTLVADRESEVMADTAGRVVQTFGDLGDEVQAGTPLARLDARGAVLSSSEARAQSALLAAQEENTKRECQRADALFSGGAISQAAYDAMTTNCATANHSLAAARARQAMASKLVSDSTLRAPFTGFIAERNIELGEYVVPGRKIATVVDSRTLRLELSVPEASAGSASVGNRIEFAVAAHPGTVFIATVRRLAPVVRRTSRDLAVEAVVDNASGQLRPGMFAIARLAVGQMTLPIVPESVLTGNPSSRRVFVVRDQQLEERVVQVGDSYDNVAPIIKGLQAGERVVTNPSTGLSDGLRIQ